MSAYKRDLKCVKGNVLSIHLLIYYGFIFIGNAN